MVYSRSSGFSIGDCIFFYSPLTLIVNNLILDENCAELVAQLFAEELIPVAAKAQKKVPIPEG